MHDGQLDAPAHSSSILCHALVSMRHRQYSSRNDFCHSQPGAGLRVSAADQTHHAHPVHVVCDALWLAHAALHPSRPLCTLIMCSSADSHSGRTTLTAKRGQRHRCCHRWQSHTLRLCRRLRKSMALAGCKVLPDAAAAAMLLHSTAQGCLTCAACGADAIGRKLPTGMLCDGEANAPCIA
jgi:hypothetical protein